MNNLSKSGDARRGFSLSGTRGLVVLGLVVAVAFLLGGWLLSGSSEESSVAAPELAKESAAPTLWTCSMHPQIKLPNPGKCPICFMDLIPLTTGSGEQLDPRQLRLSSSARELAEIQTSPVIRAFAERTVRLPGKIAYDESKLAYVAARVPGRLDRLFADYTGVAVKQGDHLVSLYSPELISAEEELLQAAQAVEQLAQSSSAVLTSTAASTLQAAREKLRLLGLTEQQVADIEQSGVATDHLTIYSPISGVVVHKNATEGMYVETGTQVYTLADLSTVWAVFEAYESDLPWLRFGQHIAFTVSSFPGETFEAVITFIDPLVDPKTRTVAVRAIVANKGQKLKPDMFAQALVSSRLDDAGHIIDESLAGKWISPMHPQIVKNGPGICEICGMALVPAESLGFVGSRTSAGKPPLLIPASAPLLTGKRAVVYVDVSDDKGPLYEGREVVLGPKAGDYYVVTSGVKEGDKVVTNGAFKLDSELQIQARPSMMMPDQAERDMEKQDNPIVSPGSGKAAAALSAVYARYFEVQMALANDDPSAAKTAGAALAAAVSGIDMHVFSSTTHAAFMELSPSLSSEAKRIGGTEDLTVQRDAFFHLSRSMIALHDQFGHSGDAVYYLTFCPMARDNAGAYWLQTENIVWNSFYGDMMLRCGEIKKPLPALGQNE